jgi:hypothetical protein
LTPGFTGCFLGGGVVTVFTGTDFGRRHELDADMSIVPLIPFTFVMSFCPCGRDLWDREQVVDAPGDVDVRRLRRRAGSSPSVMGTLTFDRQNRLTLRVSVAHLDAQLGVVADRQDAGRAFWEGHLGAAQDHGDAFSPCPATP